MIKTVIAQQANFTVLNGPEFASFMEKVAALIEAAGVESLQIPAEMFSAFKEDKDGLTDSLARSRVCDETAQIATVKGDLKIAFTQFIADVKYEKKRSTSSKQAAATSVYNLVKPLFGVQYRPLSEFSQYVKTMLVDLSKEETAEHVTTLGLNDRVAELSSLNARLGILVDTRSNKQIANKTEPLEVFRKSLTEKFDTMMAIVVGYNLAVPSEVMADFLSRIEKLIADTLATYRQRIAQRKGTEETETTTTDGKSEGESTNAETGSETQTI